MGGGAVPPPPDLMLVAPIGSSEAIYLAAWPEMISQTMTRPIAELWCVVPDNYAFPARQRVERHWPDDSLSRLGLVEAGLWGARCQSLQR